jgi:hypothetical protein
MFGGSDSISPGVDVKQYTSFASDTSLISTAESAVGRACRCIIVNSAGTGTKALEIVTTGGVTRTLTVADGDIYMVQAITIKGTTTTAARVTVIW